MTNKHGMLATLRWRNGETMHLSPRGRVYLDYLGGRSAIGFCLDDPQQAAVVPLPIFPVGAATATELACKEGGRVLSDHERSQFAEAFWRKQVGKGRAVCVQTGKGRFYANPTHHLPAHVAEALPQPKTDGTYRWWPCRRYAVATPCAVPSLEGVRRRRRKR